MVQAEKVCVKVMSPPTRPPPPANTVAHILRHLTSSFATIIITTATSVCHQTSMWSTLSCLHRRHIQPFFWWRRAAYYFYFKLSFFTNLIHEVSTLLMSHSKNLAWAKTQEGMSENGLIKHYVTAELCVSSQLLWWVVLISLQIIMIAVNHHAVIHRGTRKLAGLGVVFYHSFPMWDAAHKSASYACWPEFSS